MSQPPPKPGHGDVWLDITRVPWIPIDVWWDMMKRRDFGLRKYGTPLQYDNGREPWVDAYEESLDLVAYLHQAHAPWWIRTTAILFATYIRRSLQ